MKEPVLSVHSVSIRYPDQMGRTRESVHAVDNVSLSIGQGETYGLLGFSGCGKTTLARAVAGILPISEGRIEFEGRAISTTSSPPRPRQNVRRMGMVFQDPAGSLDPRCPVGFSIEEPLLGLGLQDRKQRRSIVETMLEHVGLSRQDASRFPHQFSGGQRQRIAIARALIAEPRLLICDEPVSALDLSVQAQIIELLQSFKRTRGLTMLFITHNIELAALVCDRVGIMSAGHLVEEGPGAEVLACPRHPITQELAGSILSVK